MANKNDVKTSTYHHGNLREESIKWGLYFLEKGKPNFSIRDIAKKIGVSHGALTRHFGAKCGLMAAIAEEGFKKFNDYLEESTREGALKEQFIKMARAYVHFSLDYPYHYKLMLGGKIPNHDQYEGLKAQGKRAFSQLVTLIENLQKSGDISKGDALKRAYTVWSGIHGLVMLATDGHVDVGAKLELTPKETFDNTREFSLEIADLCSKTMLHGFQ